MTNLVRVINDKLYLMTELTVTDIISFKFFSLKKFQVKENEKI